MRIPKICVFLLALVGSASVLAGRAPGFSMSAFNAALPESTRTAVFSPHSFELDCVVISEALGAIEKAVYVESMGALVGYDSVYPPIVARYRLGATNDFFFVSSRAYVATAIGLIKAKYRSQMLEDYDVHCCPLLPSAHGAESFLRSSMDGEMEDFTVPEQAMVSRGVSFCDLVSFRIAWAAPFPDEATRRRPFTLADGRRTEVEMMSDVREAEIWSPGRFTMLRLPMADGAWFYAVTAATNVLLSSVRADFAGHQLELALVAFKAVGDRTVYRGPVAVSLPRLSLDSTTDLTPAFLAAKLPFAGFREFLLGENAMLSAALQRTRFALDERGPQGLRLARRETPPPSGVREFALDRPFFFFVYHEPTRTVPVAGIYAGEGSKSK